MHNEIEIYINRWQEGILGVNGQSVETEKQKNKNKTKKKNKNKKKNTSYGHSHFKQAEGTSNILCITERHQSCLDDNCVSAMR